MGSTNSRQRHPQTAFPLFPVTSSSTLWVFEAGRKLGAVATNQYRCVLEANEEPSPWLEAVVAGAPLPCATSSLLVSIKDDELEAEEGGLPDNSGWGHKNDKVCGVAVLMVGWGGGKATWNLKAGISMVLFPIWKPIQILVRRQQLIKPWFLDIPHSTPVKKQKLFFPHRGNDHWDLLKHYRHAELRRWINIDLSPPPSQTNSTPSLVLLCLSASLPVDVATCSLAQGASIKPCLLTHIQPSFSYLLQKWLIVS